jgi:DNA-binding transcriptional MerR regulator
MLTLTVSDIAERIRRPHEDLRIAGDRIRNWTREGLLVPAGEKNPGTGKVRRYPETALIDAALLQVITDCTGVAAVAAGELLKEARKIFSRAQKDGSLRDSTFVISKSVGETRWTMNGIPFAKIQEYLASDPHDTHTVIGIQKLLDHVKLPNGA